jgi:hypothetical protein
MDLDRYTWRAPLQTHCSLAGRRPCGSLSHHARSPFNTQPLLYLSNDFPEPHLQLCRPNSTPKTTGATSSKGKPKYVPFSRATTAEMSHQRPNFDGSRQQPGQGSFQNSGSNDLNGYPLPSHEQYLSRFPTSAYGFLSATEVAARGSRLGGIAPAGSDNWSSHYSDGFASYQPARPHSGGGHIASPNPGVPFVVGGPLHHYPRVESGGFPAGPTSEQQQQGYLQGQEAQGRGAWHGPLYHYYGHLDTQPAHSPQEFYASLGTPSSYSQHPHQNTYSPYAVPGDVQYGNPNAYYPSTDSRQAGSPTVRPRDPVGPAVAATRFPSRPSDPSFAQLSAIAQRPAGFRGVDQLLNPSQRSDRTLSEPGIPNANPQGIQSLNRSLARRAMVAEPRRKPPPAIITRYTVLPASDSSHDPECPICQDAYDDDEHVAIKLLKTACNHVFGQKCLQDWVNSGMNNAHRCPNCRQSIAEALAFRDRPSDAFAATRAREQRMLLEMRRLGVALSGSMQQPPPLQQQSPIIPTPRTIQSAQLRAGQRRREIALAEYRRMREAEAAQVETRRVHARTQDGEQRQYSRAQEDTLQEPAAPTYRSPILPVGLLSTEVPTREAISSAQQLGRLKARALIYRRQQDIAAREARDRPT